MGEKSDKTGLAMLMPIRVQAHLTLTPAERDAIVVRARVELLKLTFELSGDDHARLEDDVNARIRADNERAEMFWREPEKAVRLALRSQLVEAMSELGFDVARLSGN